MRSGSRHLVFGWLMLLIPAEAAVAGTIEKISKDGGSLILMLEAEEAVRLAEGDQVTIDNRGGKPLEGLILELKGRRAKVAVTARKGTFKAGRAVSVAAAGGGSMSVSPATTSPFVRPEPADGPTSPPEAIEATGAEPRLFHPLTVNPSQLHALQGGQAQFRTGYSQEEMAFESASTDASIRTTGPAIGAAAVWGDRRRDIRLGLVAEYQQTEGKVDFDGLDGGDRVKLTETRFTPVLATRLSASLWGGIAYEVAQRRYTGSFYDGEHSLSWARPRPGLTVVMPLWEAGLAFAPKVREESRVTGPDGDASGVRMAEPIQTWLHASGRVGPGTRAYAVLAHAQNRVLNVDGETGWRNNAELMTGARTALSGGMELDGALYARTPGHAGDVHKSVDNIVQYAAHAGLTRPVSGRSQIEGRLKYLTARDRFESRGDETIKLEHDSLELQIAGSVRL